MTNEQIQIALLKCQNSNKEVFDAIKAYIDAKDEETVSGISQLLLSSTEKVEAVKRLLDMLDGQEDGEYNIAGLIANLKTDNERMKERITKLEEASDNTQATEQFDVLIGLLEQNCASSNVYALDLFRLEDENV